MNKIVSSFKEAVSDIPDGASVAMYNWGVVGITQNLLLALIDHGAKDLTLILPNYLTLKFPATMYAGPYLLLPQLKKLIAPYYASALRSAEKKGIPKEVAEMEKKLACEPLSLGILVERLRAAASGLGGFYSPVGIGTIVEKGKEKRVIDGKEYLLEMPLRPDYGFVRAAKADRYGNLIYKGTGRGMNPIVAMASAITIVEVDEIVEPGELDPEEIVTPAVYVDRIVEIPKGGFGSMKFISEKLQAVLSIDWVRETFLPVQKKKKA